MWINRIKLSIFTIIAFFLSLNSNKLLAQSNNRISHFSNNEFIFNPAYTGINNFLSASLLHREQWLGYQYAPSSSFLTINSPINKSILGIGIILKNDKIAIEKNISISFNLAAKIKLNYNSKLSLGFKLGVCNKQVNWEELEFYDPTNSLATDPIFKSKNTSKWIPNIGFGLQYYTNSFDIGISIPNLYTLKSNNNDYIISDNLIVYVNSSKKIKISDKFIFTPSLNLILIENSIFEFDTNLIFNYYNGINAGLGYRSYKALAFIIGYDLNPKLGLSYSFENNLSKIKSVARTSHEILIHFNISLKNRQVTSPRYFY